MFTWVCPKCGKDVPPAYSECPNCAATPALETAATPATPEAAAAPPPPIPAPRPPQAVPPAAGGHRTWLLGILFGAVLVIVVLTAFALVRSSHRRTTSAAPAAATLQNAPPAPAAAVNPAFKDIELTGFRLTEDRQQRAQLQFVIVNHSAADFGTLKLRAALRAAKSAAEEPPVATFAFTAPLGPYESKDIKVPIDTKLRAYELPDWQLLRADIIGQ